MCTPLAGFKPTVICLVLLAGFSMLLANEANAQTPPGFPGPPLESPIDGGLGLLALAGAGFAARQFKKHERVQKRGVYKE